MTQVLYGAKGGLSTTSDLYTIDPATAVPSSVGPIGYAVGGMAFDPTTGILYGTTTNNSAVHPRSLITINPTTGAGTYIGALGLGAGVSCSDIAISPGGALFGWTSGDPRGLVSISKANGTAVQVGANRVYNSGGISFAGDVLYHIPNFGHITVVDRETGGETGATVNASTTTAAAYKNGSMFVVDGTSFELQIVNLSTAVRTTIGAVFGAGVTLDSIAWSLLHEPTTPAVWLVEHYEHEFTAVTVGDPEIEDNGVLLNTVRPENLHFLWQLAELGPSEIDYEISLSAMDEIMDLPVVGLDFVRPYFQDWSLYRGTQLLLAGMITSLSIQAGSECVKLGGKDWLHYLERRMWPYDADLSYINWPDGFRFKVKAAEVGAIVQDVLETVRDVSGNFPGPPNDATFPSYSLKFTVDCDSTGINRNYEIGNFETSSVYDLVRSLSQMDKDDGGFDFYMTPDRPPATTFKLVYPEIGDPDNPIFTLEIDEDTALANMLEVGFTDSGPEASHVLGVGAGTANRAGGVNKHLRIVSARTRRLDKIGDFGDVKSLATLESKSLADLNRAWRSIHEIPILVDPLDIPGFWEITRPGEYIMVDYDLFGHRIDSVQKIVSMDVNVDLEGNERVQLGLNQLVEGGSTDVASDP